MVYKAKTIRNCWFVKEQFGLNHFLFSLFFTVSGPVQGLPGQGLHGTFHPCSCSKSWHQSIESFALAKRKGSILDSSRPWWTNTCCGVRWFNAKLGWESHRLGWMGNVEDNGHWMVNSRSLPFIDVWARLWPSCKWHKGYLTWVLNCVSIFQWVSTMMVGSQSSCQTHGVIPLRGKAAALDISEWICHPFVLCKHCALCKGHLRLWARARSKEKFNPVSLFDLRLLWSWGLNTWWRDLLSEEPFPSQGFQFVSSCPGQGPYCVCIRTALCKGLTPIVLLCTRACSMSLMKACKNRRKGAGNSNPNKRHAFRDIDQNALDEFLDLYVRTGGQAESFNLYSYKTLQAQMAASPQSFYKLHGLLDALIGVERSGCIKYKYLKSTLSTLQRRFGADMFNR